jgi:excisionase family DNA binding protein
MLTLEEVKSYLEIEQQQIEKFIGQGKLHAYKIGGTYLRFRKEEVLNLRYELAPGTQKKKQVRAGILSHAYDFWRFNNFYIISLILVGALVYLLVRS